MEVIIVDTYDDMSYECYKVVEHLVLNNRNASINTTTGATYDGMFEYLVEAINGYKLDISNTVFSNLDEYISPRDAKFSVYTYMHNKFYNLIKMKPLEIHLIDGSVSKDRIQDEIDRYSKILENNPRDLQILGLGTNAHLGANEPGTAFHQDIFVANSHQSTIESTISYHNLEAEEAPSQMITMGYKEIMEAKTILVAASGKRKAQAVYDMFHADINPETPASILRTHPNVICILDKEAASLLGELK